MNLAAVIIPLAGVVAAVVLLWGTALTWSHVAVFGVMYLATGVGVTVGYHRLFTHRAFEAVAPVRLALGMLGSMAFQGPVLEWVATHRQHHQHSDHHHDPHSPHVHLEATTGVLKGIWHSHVGWLFDRRPRGLARYVQDLRKDKVARFLNRTFLLWAFFGLVIPALLGWAFTGTWTGALLGFIWGGLVRVFMIHHITWSVNSVCHLWGTRPFKTGDESRNNALIGALALGEGWHNTHHAFPRSARHGLRWWQFDASYLFIRGLALLGLARRINVPSADRIELKRTRRTPDTSATLSQP